MAENGSFLENVAEKVVGEYGDLLHQVAIITPNRRAVLFLRKAFSQKIISASWAPDLLSMEDFIAQTTHVAIEEPVALLLRFYNLYTQIEGDKAEPLEEFLKWGSMLIKDFNDIDASVKEPVDLFNNLTDIRRMESWNPDGTKATEFQQKYIAFFDRFKHWHSAFSQELRNSRVAYQGLAWRMAAETFSQQQLPTMPWKYLIFAGFNALNQAEETIIHNLKKAGIARLFWDSDKYYLDNSSHEAGFFLRKYRKKWGKADFAFTGDHFTRDEKKIRIYGVAKNVNQARLASNILERIRTNDTELENTAVVLANEELILPVLNSLPKSIRKVNITMGLPFSKTPTYGLFDAIFQLHLTAQRTQNAKEAFNSSFYFKDIVRLFRHPSISVLLAKDGLPSRIETFIRSIFLSKSVFFTPRNLARHWGNEKEFNSLFLPLFYGFSHDPTSLISTMQSLSKQLNAAYRTMANTTETAIQNTPWFIGFEALYPLNILLRKLETYSRKTHENPNLKILFMLFKALSRETKMALSGEPLAGLQIMGMLETRNLDFENLIILSANEDILPSGKSAPTLIPLDLKAVFGIPFHKERDAIYAYHFYRLLQRAKNIHIVYNTQTQDLGSSEKSRFITQLQMEMHSWNPSISIKEDIVALPPAKEKKDHEIIIPKTPDILEAINSINKKGFSPTTLQHYIRCSLFFYFQHIAMVEETIMPEETLQANTIGSVVHEALEKLFDEQNLNNQVIQTTHIDKMLARAETVTHEKFAAIYKGGDLSSGKNLLLTKVAVRYVRNFLISEKELLIRLKKENKRITYIRSEENLTTSLTINIANKDEEIRFRGFADRIDKIEGTIRVIDYKTGKVEKEELVIKEWQDVITEDKLGKSFQLMMYALLYKKKYGMPVELTPGIISFRNPAQGLWQLTYPGGKGPVKEDAIEAFESNLEALIKDIYNPCIPIKRTPNKDSCKNCPFREVCNR